MTTHLSQSFGAASSQYKIQCTGSSVLIGDCEFLSATDALEAYVSQYENRGLLSGIKPYKRTVHDLLNPKSALRQTAERSLDTSVRATEMELRLADTKDSINESFLAMKKSVALKAEAKKNYYRKQKRRVEEALNKSADLMQQLNKDEFPNKTDCPSDVGSLTTDVLVSMNPTEGYDTGSTSGAVPSWKSKHVFGYKRPRNRRSKTLSSIQISHDMLGLQAMDQPQRGFTAQPTEKNSTHVTFQDEVTNPSPSKELGKIGSYDDDVSSLLGDSLNTSRQSRSPSKKLHERSRSVSPSILNRERKLFESGLRDKPIPDFYTDFNSMAHKTPSWVDTMNTSDVTDTDWTKRDYTTSRPPPSWVNDMDTSDITSVVSAPKPVKKLQLQDLLRPLPVINTQDSSYNSDVNDTLPPPGLTYQDLVGDTSKLKVQAGNTQMQQNQLGSPTLSEKLLNLKTKTTAALERYHERMQTNLDSPSKGSNLNSAVNVPRCSSLDASALRKGIPPPGKSDITGASPIIPGDNDRTVTALSSPTKHQVRAPSPDTDIVLDGDRPWENTASYKQPVSVQDASRNTSNIQTYSGGSQPGSLEALKNMIFKLQQEAVHTDSEDEGSRSKLSERVHKLRAEAASLGISVPSVDKPDKVPGNIPSLKDYDFVGEPGGQSLEKALVHLDRLKSMVNSHQQGGEGDTLTGTTGVTPLCANMEKV